MKNVCPDYTKICELNKRRIRRFSKKEGDSDSLLLILLGNMNERLNTMFYLMNNNIYDGVYPLQRTFYEMFIAYKSMLHSDEKEKFITFYKDKDGYETSFKWHKLTSGANSLSNSLDSWEKKIYEREKIKQEEKLKAITKPMKMKSNKLWFELASDKSFKGLSDEFSTNEDYHFCYDEPSNWVHSQRIDKNINTITFDSKISIEYIPCIYIGLFQSVGMMYSSVCDFAEYIGITESGLLSKYYDEMHKFEEKLKFFIKNILSRSGLDIFSDEFIRDFKICQISPPQI